MYPEASSINELVQKAQHILILQADNPDGDSLGSALALESILGEMGKQVSLYCGVDMPAHLKYLPGWDRVSKELPVEQYDLNVIVDTSAISLFEQAVKSGDMPTIKSKPTIVIDHHDVPSTIDFATVLCNKPVVSAGEAIYELAKQLDWPLDTYAMNAIAVSILSDSLGLMTDATSARSIHIIAELVEQGINLPQLENVRRELNRKSVELTRYKGKLLERIEYHNDNQISTVYIPWDEIERYSPEYNPSILVMDDMRMTTGTHIAIAFKLYPDGKITGKIRCNYGYPIANELAARFGGGGHPYASGFKITGQTYGDVKAACIQYATELLQNLKENPIDETL